MHQLIEIKFREVALAQAISDLPEKGVLLWLLAFSKLRQHRTR